MNPRKPSNPKDQAAIFRAPMTLLSSAAKCEWALAHYAGSLKYGKWNWREAGVLTSVYLDAMARHLDRYFEGEDRDPVDGVHHLAAVMASCAILIDADRLGKLTDDRPKVGLDVADIHERTGRRAKQVYEEYGSNEEEIENVDEEEIDASDWELEPAVVVGVDFFSYEDGEECK